MQIEYEYSGPLTLGPTYPSHYLTIIPVSQRTNTPHFFSVRDMADQSGSTSFLALYQSALQAYQKNAGLALPEHPLALQLQSCDSAESMASVLQGQAQAFGGSQGSDRLMTTIESTVSILTRLSSTASLTIDMSLVRQQALMPCSMTDRFLQPFSPVKALHAALAVLLAVCSVL